MAIHAKVTGKHQVTVPAEVREDLGLKEGDFLRMEKTGEGTWTIARAAGLESLRGILKLPDGVTFEMMDEWIAERRGRGIDRG
jgi:AbrB family looped-hinge helix DNA binding protein